MSLNVDKNKEIVDFGEKIGGARKDLWKSRGLKIEDLLDLNLKEYVEHVTKDNIWPIPNYAEYKGKMENACIYFMKNVRGKIKAKLDVYGDGKDRYRAELYIRFLNNVKDLCESMQNIADIKGILAGLKAIYTDEKGGWTNEAKETPGLDYGFIQYLAISDREIESLVRECDIQGFPDNFRGDLRGIIIRKDLRGVYRILNGSSYLSKETFGSEEEAIKYAKTGLIDELNEKKKTKKVSSVINVVRPQLEFIERVGPDIRKGQNATTDNILNTFKFRGGEFGNWNTQEDRQAYLNYTFDSLVDLAYVLNVPLDFLSLGTREDNEKRG